MPPLLRPCLALFVIAFAVRFAATLRHHPEPDNVYESTRVALSLAKRGSFADPFQIPTGPTAHVAPAYPLILSLVYRGFGDGTSGEIAKQFLTSLLSSLQYAFLVPLALLLGFARRVAFTAAAIGALFPLQRYCETQSSWESPWAAVLLMLAAALCRAGYLATPARAAMHGFTWGIALLFSPALVAVYAGFLWLRKVNVRGVAISVAITILCLLPWAYRNHLRLGSWIWLRDNLGMELGISNQDGATARLASNVPDYTNPHNSWMEAKRVRDLGEVEYNRRRFWEALTWIRDNPGHFVRLTTARIFYFWFPWEDSVWKMAVLAAITIAASAGLVRLFHTDPGSARIFAAIWVLYPPVFYLVEFDRRYRHPIDWTFLLLATFAIVEIGIPILRRMRYR